MKKILAAVLVVFMAVGLSSCGYEDKQSEATANAMQVFTAFDAALQENPDVAIAYTRYDGKLSSGNMMFYPDDVTGIDLSDYLGNSFEGYYRVYVDPQSGYVTAALWSEKEINPVLVNNHMNVSELINYYEIMGTAIGSSPYYEG